jgi:hypothetical protein
VKIEPIGPVSGTSTQVTPAADTTYVLTASNQFGSTQAQVVLPVFQPPTIWFAPDDAEFGGGMDYLNLFNPDAPWTQAASHVTVFKIYTQILLDLPDEQLSSVLADLKRRHIAVAAELGMLTPYGCGRDIEGFSGEASVQAAQRVHDLGGSLQYIAFDEPLNGATLYDGPEACHWTPLQTAQNAAQTVAQIQALFPDVAFGDIEPVPGLANADSWLGLYEQWLDAWQSVAGKPLAFFHFDVDWGANWQPGVTALSRALAMRKIPIGHIYNGLGSNSDASWLSVAEQHAAEMETHANQVPEQVIFQSWEAFPKKLLPETDPGAFTYLIDWYFRARTRLTLSNINLDPASPAWTATLRSASGPVSNATLSLSAAPIAGDGRTHAYVLSGVVPAGTQYVVLGARVAIEQCIHTPLPAEFSLKDFTLDAGASGLVHLDFVNGLSSWGIWGSATLAQVQDNQFQAEVLPGQTLGLNSITLPFGAEGSPYTFTVNAAIPVGSRGNLCASPMFVNEEGQEINRASLVIVPATSSLGSVATDANGTVSVHPGAQTRPAQLWLDYAGAATEWPAAASLLVPSPSSSPAPLQITTSSLPDGTVGVAYGGQVTATGGMPSYLWASAEVPQGLLLGQGGLVTGTPTKAGTYRIPLSVIDNSEPSQVVDSSLLLVVH